MSITSFTFLVFLAIVVLVYYIIPKRFQWAVLLVASYTFYLFSGIEQVIFIVATTLVAYGSGLLMQRIRDNSKEPDESLSKEEKRAYKKKIKDKIHTIQVITVLLVLGTLAVVKYTNFAIDTVNSVFSLFKYDAEIPFMNIIVPLGISFYTFQTIGYLVDVGVGKYKAERHLGRFALFISFFPSILQGPINVYSDLGAQLKEEHKFDYNNLKFGIQLMLWGFFKKLVIADRIFVMVSTVTNNPHDYSGGAIFFAMLVFAVFIYCDFSGGIDISRGAAQMLGINLPINFERPYFSQSVAEYWRRWHASLGGWMREYAFYPIMLSKPMVKISKWLRKHNLKYFSRIAGAALTPFIVFLLIGIWHGAEMKYVAFGLYNSIVVAGGYVLIPVFEKIKGWLRINQEAGSWKFFCMVRTFFICCIGKMFGRGNGLRESLYMIKSMFTDFDLGFFTKGGPLQLGLGGKDFAVAVVAILILLTVSILQEKGMKMRETIAKQNILFRWMLYIGIIMVILVFGIYGPDFAASEFLYQNY